MFLIPHILISPATVSQSHKLPRIEIDTYSLASSSVKTFSSTTGLILLASIARFYHSFVSIPFTSNFPQTKNQKPNIPPIQENAFLTISSNCTREPTRIPRTVQICIRASRNEGCFSAPPPRKPMMDITPSILIASRDCAIVEGPPTSRMWDTPSLDGVRDFAFEPQSVVCL
jgi:hypothetical protein